MPQIVKGQAIAYFAFDIGYEIALDQVPLYISSLPVQPISRKKQTPTYLQYQTAPQVLFLGEIETPFGVKGQIYATVYDFGAVSISYRWPLDQVPLEALPQFSERLYQADLEDHAKQQVENLFQNIQKAISRPHIANLIEDYYIFVLEQLDTPIEGPINAMDLRERYGATMAQVLRFDTSPLNLDQQKEALAKTLSYYENDLVIIDWNTAIVYDTNYADTLSVLELLNVELLEYRYIDSQLDNRVDEYEDILYKQAPWFIPLYSPYRKTMNELAELRIESSLVTERVENALKLIGDLYLARVHKAASERFYMHEWEQAISRKLDIIDNLYNLVTDRLRSAQSQTLEFVIVILILLEIILSLLEI